MALALASGWFPPGTTVEGMAAGLAALRLRGLLLTVPAGPVRGWREVLGASGVRTVGVALGAEAPALAAGPFPPALTRAVEAAVALKAPWVLVEAGALPGEAGARLAALERALRRHPAEAEAATARAEGLALRAGPRERLVEQVARALHGPLREGVPLAVVPGDGAEHLLGLTETGWLLEALPRLMLWLDAARAERAARLGLGPALTAWTDAWAGRTVGVLAHGLGGDLAGHAHPEEDGPAWGSLGESLPRGLPWVLDVSGRLSAADVRDALRCLAAAGAVADPG